MGKVRYSSVLGRCFSAGDFVDNAINILAFGLPGAGKGHALAALGPAPVRHRLEPTDLAVGLCDQARAIWAPCRTC